MAIKSRMHPAGFDVVCTIGRVELGEGNVHPDVAAFSLIAQHGAPGVFTFPNPNGDNIEVEVRYPDTSEEGQQ